MKIIFLKVATFLMIIQGGHVGETHEHVHCESPEWRTLSEEIVRTSGDTSTGLPTCYWEGG